MVVGFTGTRQGMTAVQTIQLRGFLEVLWDARRPNEFHHGGAAGADASAWRFAVLRGYEIHWHPCPGVSATDETSCHCWHEVLAPLVRNRLIVEVCDVLIAAPFTGIEQLRSGTWATVRHARKASKPVVMLSRGR